MLLISLDEQGNFEDIQSDTAATKAPVFIGGVIFDDRDIPGEYETEKKRIYLYLKSVCQDAGTAYPQDLHVGSGNNARVRLTKQKLSETLSTFLREGRYGGENSEFSVSLNRLPVRKGKYTIFVYLKYGTGIRRLSAEHASILVREGYASNLYLHMAEEVVSRILFYNPVIENIREVRLDLATRRIVLDEGSEKVGEYLRLGYRDDPDPSHRQEGKRTFILTDADIYRTALEREMLNADRPHLRVDRIGVKSIFYGHEETSYRMQFLYLADIICSMLGFLPDASSPEALMEGMKERADSYTGHEDNLIFAYDDVDLIFRKARGKLEEKDYYSALQYAHEGKKSDSPYAEFYSKHWFRRLKDEMLKKPDRDALAAALRRYYLSTRTNALEQDELVDMYQVFEGMAENMTFRNAEDRAVLYELYDAGTAAFCHIGDSAGAERCFRKCCEYAKYVEIERYLRTRNKMVVFLTDLFEFDRALSIAQENVIFQEELLSVRELVFDAQEISKNYGISLSQLGQIQASLHMPEGEQTFLRALAQMGEDTSPDYLQTESYLLHYYLEMGEKKQYDRYAEHYFGGNRNLANQLRYLIHEGEKGPLARFSMKFALYVYVKGLYRFHLDDISENLMDKLLHIEDEIKNTGGETAFRQINNHPWEMIYKILALIALKAGEQEKAEEYMEKAETVLTYHGFTLDVICLFGKLEYMAEKGDIQEIPRLMDRLAEMFKDNSPGIYGQIQKRTLDDAYLYLKRDIVNYMYR